MRLAPVPLDACSQAVLHREIILLTETVFFVF